MKLNENPFEKVWCLAETYANTKHGRTQQTRMIKVERKSLPKR